MDGLGELDPIVVGAERALAASTFDKARYSVLNQFFLCWEDFHRIAPDKKRRAEAQECADKLVAIARMLRRMDA